MNIQIPHGWDRYRLWFTGGIDDYGWRYREFILRPFRHRELRIQWGIHTPNIERRRP